MNFFNFFKPAKTPAYQSILENHKIFFDKTFLIVGEKYECRKNPKKKRSDVIKKTSLKSSVYIEKYFYNNLPAYMIVNAKNNLDLGVLSAGAASWLTDYYMKGETVVYLTDRFDGSFHVRVIVYQPSK